MRVCLICNQLAAWGKIGGIGVNARRLGKALAEHGIDVHVALPRRRGQGRVESLDGMTVHGMSVPEVFFGKQLYRDIDADIYHMQEPTICGYRAQEAMPQRIHLVTSMDPRERADRWTEFRNATWSRRLKYPVQVYFENGRLVHKAVRRADGVFVEAELLKEKTRRLYKLPESPGFLPKPIDIPKGPFNKDENPLCVFVGRFDPRKRPEMFFQLAARMPDVNFIAVGRANDQGYQNYLSKRYFHLPNLTVTGFIDPFLNEELQEILSRAWILLHPAAREGLCTAFQEASVNEVGILAYVDPGGYVSSFGEVLPDDGLIETFEKRVRTLLDENDWREKARAGRKWNITHHSTENAVSSHIAEYEKALSAR